MEYSELQYQFRKPGYKHQASLFRRAPEIKIIAQLHRQGFYFYDPGQAHRGKIAKIINDANKPPINYPPGFESLVSFLSLPETMD